MVKHESVEIYNKPIAVMCAFFLSGAAALIYEIVWIRSIVTVLSSTTYVLSIVLTSFMLGLAFGGIYVSKKVAELKYPERIYAYLEFTIGIYGLVSITAFNVLSILTRHQYSGTFSYFSLQLLAVFILLFIPTFCMGATFPLISKVYVKSIGKGVGELYTLNTAGGIIGSLLAGFVLLPFFGVKYSLILAAILNLLAGLVVLYYSHRSALRVWIPLLLVMTILIGGLSRYTLMGHLRSGFLGIGDVPIEQEGIKMLYEAESLYGNVAVWGEGGFSQIKRLAVNGQGSSSERPSDVRVSTLSAYLPLLQRPDASSALVVGLGTGAASGILSNHMKTVTVEIEPRILETTHYFENINNKVLQNPNHSVVIDDARHFLQKDSTLYDIIVNHPLDPFQSFSSLLFTKEFMKIAKESLKPNGVYVQWLPVYDLSKNDFLAFYKTFHTEFPYVAAFVNLQKGESFDYVVKVGNNEVVQMQKSEQGGGEFIVLGSDAPLSSSMQSLVPGFERISEEDIEYLGKTSLESPDKIASLLVFTETTAFDTSTAKMITDDKPLFEFSTPLYGVKRSTMPNPSKYAVTTYLESLRP